MPRIAIYAIIVSVIFGSGYGACWKRMTGQVATLNAQIEVSNADAKRRLLESVAATEKAEHEATIAAVQLETEHDKNLQLNSVINSSLATVRMRVRTVYPDCRGSLSKGSNTKVADSATGTADLPEDFARLLRAEALRADNLAVYANEAYKFVKSNCGINQ